jgi:UDP-N-acetylmuramate dehydrogenase
MKRDILTSTQIKSLQTFFGDKLKKDELLSRYSVMNVGGPADYLVTAGSSQDLEAYVCFLWEEKIPFLLLGGGSNTLISDSGIRELVLINEAKEIKFLDRDNDYPLLWAESGASFGSLARRAGSRGWTGLEWASGIPGTVGGAVINNAGAFGSNVAEKLEMADILHPSGDSIQRSKWSVDQFAYDYRSSVIKSGEKQAVVLSAAFKMELSTPAYVKGKISAIAEKRKSSQPSGASLGSMFKNPPGDFAGRLIEATGLKGTRVGDVEISPLHGNFFLNRGNATAADIASMIAQVRDQVHERFGVELELEIQFIGDWN